MKKMKVIDSTRLWVAGAFLAVFFHAPAVFAETDEATRIASLEKDVSQVKQDIAEIKKMMQAHSAPPSRKMGMGMMDHDQMMGMGQGQGGQGMNPNGGTQGMQHDQMNMPGGQGSSGNSGSQGSGSMGGMGDM